MAELNPPLGTTTPEIFLDNVKRADELVNGPAGTVNDRGGEPLDTWRQMMAKNDEVRQNIIPLSKQYMTLSAAQADIANIPEGSTTYVRSADGSSLADEYINNAGTLEPTGRKMGIKQLDLTAEYPAATWLHNYSITGTSNDDYVTVNNKPTVTGTCVLITVTPETTVYIGIPVDYPDRFRLLDQPGYPVDGMKRAGDRYTYDGTGSGAGNFEITVDGDVYGVKEYTTASDTNYILVYQSLLGDEYPVIFSTSKDEGYKKLTAYTSYSIHNDVIFNLKTKNDISDFTLSSRAFQLVANEETADKLVGYELASGTGGIPWLNANSRSGLGILTWVAAINSGKRYTVILKINTNIGRFRIAGYQEYPSRRGLVTHMYSGLGAELAPKLITERNGDKYAYVTFDSVSDESGVDNWLAMNLTDTGKELPFSIIEGDYIPGESYKSITERVKIGVPVNLPVAHIGKLTSDIIVKGKNIFDGVYVYGYSDSMGGSTTDDYTAHLNVAREVTDDNYKDVVAAIIPVESNTTYAVSKSGGTRFRIGVAKGMPSISLDTPLKMIVADDFVSSAIIKTGPDDKFVFIYLSNAGGVNWLQVEKGESVTSPESFGWKFSPAAQSISQAIESSSDGYISAGVGDGVADDSDDIQAVINLTAGVISFNPAKTYFISKSLNVNASIVKAILGNRTTFIIDGDYPVFKVEGGMTSGSANPATNGVTARREGGFRVDSVRAYSRGTVTGVGVALSNMFKPRITNCDFMYLRNGIQFSGLNRDVIISNNHIYACHDYGVYFDDSADIHQLNILGNIITYCTRNIYLDNADIYNLQIVGNDIELGSYPSDVAAADKAVIWVNAKTSLVEDVSVVCNTLEDHATSNRLLKFDGLNTSSILSVVIAGNSTGNSKYLEIEMGGISGVDITGQFKKSAGSTLGFTGPVNGLHMCVQANKQSGFGGLVLSDGPYELSNISIEGCQMNGSGAYKAIRITGKPIIENLKIHGNNIYDKDVTPSIYIEAASVNGVRADFNQIDNSFDSSVTQAIVINADSVSGKNSMMFNSATTGAFVAPDGFNVQGNF